MIAHLKDKNYWNEYYQQNQHNAEILFKNRCNWWVDCGTLLGIHRDKSLIKGDSDADCGIDVESITPELLKDMEPHFGKGDGGRYMYNFKTRKNKIA